MSVITKDNKLYPHDIARCTTIEEAQDMAMLIALQNLGEIRELQPLANGGEAYCCEYCIWTIRRMCREWYFSLADIGTSEEELTTYLRTHVLTTARHDLQYERAHRRQTDDSNAIGVRNLRALLTKGGYSPADIGTTEAELADLAQKGQPQ
jgi:hypothetical protein